MILRAVRQGLAEVWQLQPGVDSKVFVYVVVLFCCDASFTPYLPVHFPTYALSFPQFLASAAVIVTAGATGHGLTDRGKPEARPLLHVGYSCGCAE